MLPADVSGDAADRTPADNQTVRNVFVIGPDKKIKLILVYPMTTGRNFDEVLRVIDSLQLTAQHKVATPANWQQGDDVIIAGSVCNDQAKEIYPDGWEEPRPYIRIVPQPEKVEGLLAEALQQVAEDPRGRAPDQVAVDLVGRGVDRDAAADQAADLVALAQDVQREGEDGLDLGRVRLEVELRGVGDAADEGVDAVAGDEGAGRRQRLAELDRAPGRGRSPPPPRAARSPQVGVAGVPAPAGEGDLAGVAAQVGAALGEDQSRARRASRRAAAAPRRRSRRGLDRVASSGDSRQVGTRAVK